MGNDKVECMAAEATLVALRSTLVPVDRNRSAPYYLLPHMGPLTRESAIEALIALKKPVACIGVPVGGSLGVATWPRVKVFGARFGEPDNRAVRADDAVRRRLEEAYGSSRVLLLGHNESVVMSLEEIAQWRERYEILFETSVIDENDERARAAGVAAVMRFLPLSSEAPALGIGTTE